MPEVFIDRLTVENFGPFYGETTFDFKPLEGRQGILIGGRNGAGKTHLLRALYLAVVGETGAIDLANLEKSGSDATRFRFEHSLSRKAAAEGNYETRLTVDIVQRDEQGAGAKRVTLTARLSIAPVHLRDGNHLQPGQMVRNQMTTQ